MSIKQKPYSGYTYLDDGYICSSFNYDDNYMLYVIYRVNCGSWSGRGSQINVSNYGLSDGDYVEFAGACIESSSDINYLRSSDYLILDRFYYYKPRLECPSPQDVYIYEDSISYYVEYYIPSRYDSYIEYSRTGGAPYRSCGGRVYKSDLSNNDVIRFRVRTERSGYTPSGYMYTSTLTYKKRPDDFRGFNMSSGDTMSYSRVNDNLVYCYPVRASEWTDFYNKINEFRRYKGYGSAAFSPTSRDDNITANRFNEAVYAIMDISSENLSIVHRGDSIYASDFKNLKNKLNNIS